MVVSVDAYNRGETFDFDAVTLNDRAISMKGLLGRKVIPLSDVERCGTEDGRLLIKKRKSWLSESVSASSVANFLC